MRKAPVLQTLSPVQSPVSSMLYDSRDVQFEDRSLSSTGKFVLVIENSPTIQKIIEMTLQQEGYEVCSFLNGIDAMRWFAEPTARIPDLMLVELDLPKLDGYHIIQKFKAKPRFARTACILLSQYENAERQLKECPYGTITSLRKPFTTQQLIAAAHSYIIRT